MRQKTVPGPFAITMRGAGAIWLLAYALVTILGAVQGRGVEIVSQGPLWMIAMAQSAVMYQLFWRLASRPAWLLWAAMMLAAVAAGALQTTADIGYLYLLSQTIFPAWREWAGELTVSRVGGVLILYAWGFMLMVALIWAVRAGETSRLDRLRAAEAEAAAQRAQLAALRLQLNPHFLFNTLNAISTLVLERDTERAERMIERLSSFLRSSLQTDPDALITLGEELDTIEAYLEIEAVRFEGRLEVSFDCPGAVRDALVPGFLLQPLVENAMKYGVAPAMRPVRVSIGGWRKEDDLVLEVRDNGEGVAEGAVIPGGGVGLANVRARLRTLYGSRGQLRVDKLAPGFVAQVRVPYSPAGVVKLQTEGARP